MTLIYVLLMQSVTLHNLSIFVQTFIFFFFTDFCLIFGYQSVSDFPRQLSQDYFKFWSHINMENYTWFWAEIVFWQLCNIARQKWGFHAQLCFFWIQKYTSLTWNILLKYYTSELQFLSITPDRLIVFSYIFLAAKAAL